jgi:molybdopterin-binding protein
VVSVKLYELKDVLFTRSDRFTLEIGAFSLSAGEKVAVVGRNGAGKTTLLRLLALLEKPTACAHFTYRGRPPATRGLDRNGLGFLKQQPYIFSGTVAQNLGYPLKLRGVPSQMRRKQVRAMLALIELAPLADAPARSLSGGEQKRLALGRALIAEPDLLLLDEPVAHLDRRSRGVIERVLRQTAATIVMTTHDLHFAHLVAERVLILKDGKISPSLPENILEGRREGRTLVTASGLRIQLPPATATQNGDQRLTVMLDPRSLVVSLDTLPSSMRNHFRGRVCTVREQGPNVWLEIDCGDRLTTIISRESYAELGINLDREVVVSFKANAVEVL